MARARAFRIEPQAPSLQDDSNASDPLPGMGQAATLEAGLARARTRQALFGGPEVEQKIDRFTVLEHVGSGAMGSVYAAYDPNLDRRIALKLLAPGTTASPKRRERMLAEARAMAKVAHPNVVTVFEVGVWEGERDADDSGSVFVAMEFVRGRTLRQWHKEVQPQWRSVIDVYVQAGRGLAAVHRAGLVHRDFKPDNAMLDEHGRVRVMDFGLARDDEGPKDPPTNELPAMTTEELTGTGEIVGTPAYMAPEQFAGLPADPQSDQWAFCVALYEALAGRRPFVAESPHELATRLLSRNRPPDPLPPGVPRRIRQAVMRGLRFEPNERWPSMDALVDAISPRRRGRWALGWMGLGATVLVAGWVFHAPARDKPCEGASAAYDAAWDETQADRVRDAFEQTSLSYAERSFEEVQRTLDAYSTQWLEQHRDACEAARVAHTQSDAMLDRRMRCLDRRRQEVVALVDALVEIDADGVAQAGSALEGLVPPHRCGSVAFLDAATEPPADPAVARAVSDLRAELAEVSAHVELGKAPSLVERLDDLEKAASSTGYDPLLAETHLVIASVLDHVGDFDQARGRLEEAYFGARAAKNPITAAAAALELASLLATAESKFELAHEWLRLAEIEHRAHGLEDHDGMLVAVKLVLLEREGRFDEALRTGKKLIASLEERCADHCELLPEAHETVALLYTRVSIPAEAIVHARKAIELESARHGDEHPHLATSLLRLGDVLDAASQPEKAAEALSQAFAMRERIFGEDHLFTATIRIQLAVSLVQLGRGDEALQQAERAVKPYRAHADPQHLAAALNQLGWIYSELERHRDAEQTYAEAAEAMRTLHPDGHPNLAIVLSNIAQERRLLGDPEAALQGYQAAIAMRRKTVTGYDPRLTLFLLPMGQVLADLGREQEAIDVLHEAVAAAREEDASVASVTAYTLLVKLLQRTDPARARTTLAEAQQRCAALPESGRQAAHCEKLDALAP